MLVSIEEWEAIQRERGTAPEDALTPEEAERMQAAWEDYTSGRDPGTPLELLRKELLDDRAD